MLGVAGRDLEVTRGEVYARSVRNAPVGRARRGRNAQAGQALHRLGWQDITTKDVDPLTSQGDAYQTLAGRLSLRKSKWTPKPASSR